MQRGEIRLVTEHLRAGHEHIYGSEEVPETSPQFLEQMKPSEWLEAQPAFPGVPGKTVFDPGVRHGRRRPDREAVTAEKVTSGTYQANRRDRHRFLFESSCAERPTSWTGLPFSESSQNEGDDLNDLGSAFLLPFSANHFIMRSTSAQSELAGEHPFRCR